MNLREFYKKLRSPMGTSLLSLGGLVLLVLLALPFLLRTDAGKLEVNRTSGGDGSYDIYSNIKAVANTSAKSEQAETGKVSPADPKKGAPKPPAIPGRSSEAPNSARSTSDRRFDTYSRTASPTGKSLITIIDGETAASGQKEFISERYAPYGRLIACKLVNTVESGDTDTPLIAFVTEDLWWINSKGEKKLIIPAGTEVHGTVMVRNHYAIVLLPVAILFLSGRRQAIWWDLSCSFAVLLWKNPILPKPKIWQQSAIWLREFPDRL